MSLNFTSIDQPIRIKFTSFAARGLQIKAIRIEVFHQEQKIDPALDFDGLDEEAIQVVAYIGDQAVGTMRVRQLAEATKIERVAVLLPYRKQGVGTAMMLEILTYLRARAITNIILSAQRTSESFYRKLGFMPHGDAFREAGIEHIHMHYRPPIDEARSESETS
ncbi:MAG: GNAT family N-acetyltransferase [Cyanobacteria bacterium P01_A01_bin.17]